jgi:hypothetical protein
MRDRRIAGIGHLFVGLLLLVASGDRPGWAVPAGTFEFPAGTLNQRLTVVGRLELEGRNYFLDPRFVIVDDQGSRIPVKSWAPLELSPLPPGALSAGTGETTMSGYLHRRLSVIGIHRLVVGSPGQPGLLGPPGTSYLEVQAVTDDLTGRTLFTAADTIESTYDALPATQGEAASAGSSPQRQLTGERPLESRSASPVVPVTESSSPGYAKQATTEPLATDSGPLPVSMRVVPTAGSARHEAQTLTPKPLPTRSRPSPVVQGLAPASSTSPRHETQTLTPKASTTRSGPPPVEQRVAPATAGSARHEAQTGTPKPLPTKNGPSPVLQRVAPATSASPRNEVQTGTPKP